MSNCVMQKVDANRQNPSPNSVNSQRITPRQGTQKRTPGGPHPSRRPFQSRLVPRFFLARRGAQ